MWGERAGADGLALVDLDGDGHLEAVVAAQAIYSPGEQIEGRWYIVRYDGTFHQTWSSFEFVGAARGLQPLCSSGSCEIAVGTDAGIDLYDAGTRRIVRTIPSPAPGITAFAIGDLTDDPGLEVALCTADDLFLLDFETGLLIGSRLGFGCRRLALGQTDADPGPEIVTIGNPFGLFVLDGASLDVKWVDPAAAGSALELADLDGDETQELIYQLGPSGGLRAASAAQARVLWTQDPLWFETLSTADLDPHPGPEIVVSQVDSGSLHVLSASDGTELWSLPGWTGGARAIVFGDLDGDGSAELLVSTGFYSSLVAIDPSSRQIESASDPIATFLPNPAIADLDADGDLELSMVCSEDEVGSPGGRFLIFDFATRESEYLGPPLAGQWSTPGFVLVAQLDTDPQLELCTFPDLGSWIPTLHCEDGSTHQTEWDFEFDPNDHPEALLASDFDGDGVADVAAAINEPAIVALGGGSGSLIWRTPTLSVYSDFDILRSHDVDGDGVPELIAGGRSSGSGQIAVFSSNTGDLVYGPFGDGISAFDIAAVGDPPQPRVALAKANGDLVWMDPVSGDESAPIANYPGAGYSLRLADLTRDGVLDWIFMDAGRVVVHDGAQNSEIWRSGYLSRQAGWGDRLWVGDFDGDTVPEILVATDTGFMLFAAPPLPIFADGFESGDTSAWSAAVP